MTKPNHPSACNQSAAAVNTSAAGKKEDTVFEISLPPEKQKAIDELTIYDDKFMYDLLDHNPELVEEIMQKLLSDPQFKVASCKIEKNAAGNLFYKKDKKYSAIIKDDKGSLYNLQFQADQKDDLFAKMFSEMSSLKLLASHNGNSDHNLQKVQTIFVCRHDFLKTGKTRTAFTFQSDNDDCAAFGLNAALTVINGDSTEDSDLGSILHDFRTADPEQMHSVRLAKNTARLKLQKKDAAEIHYLDEVYDNLMRQQYLEQGRKLGFEQSRKLALELEHKRGLEQGIAEGIKRTEQKLLEKMRAAGFSEEQIQLLFSKDLDTADC